MAELNTLVDLYHKSVTMPKPMFEKHYGAGYSQADVECEVRFGTNRKAGRAYSKLDYDRVVQQFQQAGFTTDMSEGLHMLRINTEYFNTKQQQHVFSNIRTEIRGLDMVQQYVQSNDLVKLMQAHKMDDEHGATDPNKVRFTQKKAPEIDGERVKPVECPDFNFRVCYQMEKNWLPMQSDVVQKTLDHWTNVKKTFRYLNRVRFRHPKHPVFLDVSIIKSSATEVNRHTKQRIPIPEYTVQDAHVFENAETYEIELEFDNAHMAKSTVASVVSSLRHCIRLVLSGLQGSAFPIGFAERNQVLQEYLALLGVADHINQKVTSYHFIGPQPMTLQTENLASIQEYYSVTDKADGDRKLLFVSPATGKIYLLDTTMNVTFVGRKVKDEKMWNSLLDGEHIKRNRNTQQAMNKFKIFDIYFWAGKSVRELAFYEPLQEEKVEVYEQRFRLPLVQKWVRDLVFHHPDESPPIKPRLTDFTVEAKTFLTTFETDIFSACREIWEAVQHPAYEYATDGLIFTPLRPGVGSDRVGVAGPLHKHTWKAALKWKPPQNNTIDFLVRIKDAPFSEQTTLTLCCGFNPRDHGYLNPRQMMLDDKMQLNANASMTENDYLPCAFQPSDPADPDAHICEWNGVHQGNGEYILKTEEGDYFDHDVIVEFRYDKTAASSRRRWIPLRVRYDKTNELRMGYKNYGNAFHVAESNWRSIWYEVTEHMITTGQDIPNVVQDDVYYNRTSGQDDGATRGLRLFHNHFVKRRLLLGVCKPDDHLLDLGVGKAGDLRKWADANVAFVWGIDLSHDNIENRHDGACARYVGLYRQQQGLAKGVLPKALFMQGNVTENICTGEAFVSAKDKDIARALFGKGPRDKTELGAGVYPHYGVAERGFHVTSCQFAIHYFFKDVGTLRSFLKNVAECTREQGYFICTCFDGNLVFDRLQRLSEGMAVTLKGFEMVKRYNQTTFADDETSLGYAVDVFQDSINTCNREYLVNFAYFKREMENGGFVLLEAPEAQSAGFVAGSGLFSELHAQLTATDDERLATDMDRAIHMTLDEKNISFLNRYYIFKKVRSVEISVVRSKDEPLAKSQDEPLAKSQDAKSLAKSQDAKSLAKSQDAKSLAKSQDESLTKSQDDEPLAKSQDDEPLAKSSAKSRDEPLTKSLTKSQDEPPAKKKNKFRALPKATRVEIRLNT